MSWLPLILILQLLLPDLVTSTSSWLRVETGHQSIEIDGRDSYLGYFTRIHLHDVTCIQGLLIHCLKPLTGAEEIEILLSQCPRGNWRVVHYTNTKEEFRLKWPFNARQMMVVSRQPLNVIDVQVQACQIDNSTLSTLSSGCKHDHGSRHGRTGPIRATEYGRKRRYKRDIIQQPTDMVEVIPRLSNLEIFENKIVEAGKVLRIEEGTRILFGDDVSLIVYGSLIVNGSKYAPVKFEAAGTKWKGVQVITQNSPTSSLKYLNISQSEIGLSVTNGSAISIENVVVDGNDVGLKIQTDSSSIRISKTFAVNNAGPGFHFSGKGTVELDTCISASNKEHGILFEDGLSLSLKKCNLFSNSKNAISIHNSDHLEIRDSVIDSNGAGVVVSSTVEKDFYLTFTSVNISNHHYGPVVQIKQSKTIMEVDNCSIFDNYFGAIHLDDNHIQLEIANSKFLRNRGKIVYLPLLIAGRIIIGKNVFSSNQFNDYADGEAVIEIITSVPNKEDASINVFQNEFSKNIMNNIIHLRRVTGSEVNAIVSDSDFHGNLAQTIIRTTSMQASIQYNFLHNVQSSCDISVPIPSHSEESKNYWGYDNHKEILEHICANNDSYSNLFYNQDLNVPSSTTFPTPPKLDVKSVPLPSLQATYNLIKKQETPYLITEDIIIKADQTVIVEPGSRLLFSPGTGIIIEEKGKLYMNGTLGNEISLSSNGDGVWKGISLKPGGLIFVSDAIINDPSVGLWVDSDRSTFSNVQINRPTVHGIELTGNSAAQHDFGGSSINDALATAIVVDERRSGLIISNVSINNPAVSGIDFVSPSADLQLKNINISSAHSHSIHISEYPTAPLQSLSLEDVQVSDQKRGHSAIFVNSGWIRNLTFNRIKAQGNSVPSIVLSIDCNSSPSMSTIRNSEFLNNLDTVILMQLGECGGLNLNRNIFRSNNENGRGGVLRIDVQPTLASTIPITVAGNNFIENKGDFTAFLSSETSGITGKFENNSLEENSNSVATVVVTSPFYTLHNNRFYNPQSAYEIEARGDGSWTADASHNWWGTTDEKQIESRLKSFEGTVVFQPLRADDFHPEVTITHPDVQVPILASQYEACAQANFCSYRGSCLAGICVCPIGYIGTDCSVLVGCKNNCSNNGACGLFNACSCNEGWTSTDCSVPICTNNCGNHGFCVGKDECKCDKDWTGPDCSQAACSPSTCIHGQCDENDKCVCTEGYEGTTCSRPLCSSCSINGRCTSPGVCECFDDYGGIDCSECIGNSCNQCDFDCDHGTCEPSTRTCSCSAGWTGAACDVCPATCVTEPPTLVYIQPSTSSHMTNSETVVSVFGKFFHKTKTNTFSCIFGAQKTDGVRISSTLIRCPVPSNITVGRHIFSVESLGVVAQPIDGRPIHFTVYESCEVNQCQGTCYGPLCLCPRGKTGLFCEIIEVKPEIDKLFLTNQVANKAFEGVPYIVYLPSMPGTVLTVNSTVPDLNFDSSRSLLEWPDPVGQLKPHMITVSANSLAGDSQLSWNLAIEPSYDALVDDVTSNGKAIIVKGHIDNEKLGEMPVVIQMHNSNGLNDEVTLNTAQDGTFLYTFLPNGGGTYSITARHPGKTEKDYSGRSITVEAEIPELPVQDYKNGKLIGLPDKTCVPSLLGNYKSKLTEELIGNGKVVRVEFSDEDPSEIPILLKCDNHKEFLRLTRNLENINDAYEVFPDRLVLQQNKTHYLSNVVEIIVRGSSFKAPVKLSSTTTRIFIITNSLRENEDGKEDFHVSLQMDISAAHNGSISVLIQEEEIYTLPYSIVDENTELFQNGNFRMKICLNDESQMLSTSPGSRSSLATMAITNLQLKKDFTKSHSIVINGPPAEYLIPEGMYEVVAQSPNHERYQNFLKLSPHNSSICLRLKSLSPYVPTEYENGEWHITPINKQIGSYPYLQFQPDNINKSVSSVYVTVQGVQPGVVSPRKLSNKFFNMIPRVRSVSVNDSFWIQLEHLNFPSNSSGCDVFLFDVSFDFLPEAADGIISLSSPILIELGGRKLDSQPKLCRDDGDEEIQSATSTNILCDCSQGAKAQCRSIYRSPASCGSSWKRIADDTISLQVVSAFLLMISECNDVQLNFTDLHQTLQCVSSLESKCPLSNNRIKRLSNESSLVDLLMFQTDPVRSLRQISSSAESFINPLNVLNSFDLQSIRIASLYQDFIERLQDVFPSFVFELEREKIDLLITAIGDSSVDGNYISSDEENFVNDHQLTQLWNNTVKEWNSGKWSFFDHSGIPFASMKQLIASADRLKSFNRQNGGTDPFSVLHEYLGRLLKTTSHPDTICLQATSFITPKVMYENDAITIDVFVRNLKNIPISQVALTIDIVRDDAFSPQAKLVANGISVNTLSAQGILPPNSSFVSSWTKRVVFSNQLTSIANYQLIIALSFTVEGKETKQRLITRALQINPIKSLKIVHFVAPILQSSKLPFSLMTSIMNNGYTNLHNVRVESTDLQVSSPQNIPLQFHIDSLKLNDNPIEPSTSFNIGDIASGTSKVVTMNISSSDSLANLTKIKTQMSADGTTIAADDSSIYKVHATAGQNGILVSVMDYDEPLFFFRPETGNLVNIIPLEFQKSSTEEAKQPIRTIVQATFQNKESRSFFGYLFGSFPYPNVPNNYELVQIREQNINRPRDVRPIVWIDESVEGKMLNFIDGGSLNPSYEQSYDFVFADPMVLSVPFFSQNAYRIQLQRDDWPTPGSSIGHISVENDNNDVEYSLFSPDDSSTFSVHPQTGHIFMDSPALPGNEFCLLLKAKKSNGEEASVPVSINTGGSRRDCITFNTYGLTPRVHPGSIEFPTPPTFSPSIPTNPTLPTEPTNPTVFVTTTEPLVTSEFPTPPTFTPSYTTESTIPTEQTNPTVIITTTEPSLTSEFPTPPTFTPSVSTNPTLTTESSSSTVFMTTTEPSLTSEFPTPPTIFTTQLADTSPYPTPTDLTPSTFPTYTTTLVQETTEYASTHEIHPDSTLSPYITSTTEDTIESTIRSHTSSIEFPTPPTFRPSIPIQPTFPTYPTKPTVIATTTEQIFTSDFPTPSPWTQAVQTTDAPIESTSFVSTSTHFITPDSTISSIDVSTSAQPTGFPVVTTTENPFYGNACIKTSSSIYSLICQLDKLIVDE